VRSQLFIAFVGGVCAASVSAQELGHFQTLLDKASVETRTLMIRLDRVNDDVRFAVTLRDKETGLVIRHEFDGEGTNDPSPFQFEEGYPEKVRPQSPAHRHLPSRTRSPDPAAAGFFRCFRGLCGPGTDRCAGSLGSVVSRAIFSGPVRCRCSDDRLQPSVNKALCVSIVSGQFDMPATRRKAARFCGE